MPERRSNPPPDGAEHAGVSTGPKPSAAGGSRLKALARGMRARLPDLPPVGIGRPARKAVGLILPPRCASCGEPVESDGALCSICWRDIAFIAAPQCARCGFPFDHDHGPDMICADCAGAEPPFRTARAAAVYDAASREMVLAFKHGDRTDLARLFAGWLIRVGGGALRDADLIVPVPLHWTRLLRRRYNQSALIGRLLAKRAAVRFAPHALIRRRATPSLGSLSAAGRRSALRGVFAVDPKACELIEGAGVALIDDVYTTGATARACCRTLSRAGARHVDVLTATRRVRTMP